MGQTFTSRGIKGWNYHTPKMPIVKGTTNRQARRAQAKLLKQQEKSK